MLRPRDPFDEFGREQWIAEPDAPPADEPEPDAGLPTIRFGPDLYRVVDDAEHALIAATRGELFQRSGELVRVRRDSVPGTRGVLYPAGGAVIAAVPDAHLQDRLSRAALWQKARATRTGEPEWIPCVPPEVVVRALAARGTWALPVLIGVSETPVLRPDGSILQRPGYDPETGILYDPGTTEYPDVPERPSHDDARRAYSALEDVFCDFPFEPVERDGQAIDAGRAAAVAGILTLIGRAAFEGPAPAFAWIATTPGSGKSLGARVTARIGTGREAPTMAPPQNDEEARKRITTLAIEGATVALIDNIEGLFGSPALAGALTCGTWKDRILGASESREVPLRIVWFVTGNNLAFKGDLGRRVVPIYLDPKCEHPEDRTGFAFPRLEEHVMAHRAELVTAALTVLRAYVVAGKPAHGASPKGSYEAWDELVRGAVLWAGGADPLAGCERIRAEGDADLEALRAALGAWADTFGEAPHTLAEVLQVARTRDALRDALATLAKVAPEKLEARRLGYALRARKGRIAGRQRFTQDGVNRVNAALWRVERVSR